MEVRVIPVVRSSDGVRGMAAGLIECKQIDEMISSANPLF
jgi:hypothetical protein